MTTNELKTQILERLEAETRAHVERTAVVARELAAAHGVDPERAELAALVHDIADGYSDIELLVLAERYDVPITLTEARIPKLLHAPIGAEILRRDYDVTDEELLDAVRDHISGGPHMGKLAKVLFVADKIEPHRDRHYRGLDPVRELAVQDLDQAMLKLYAWRIDELVNASRPVQERMIASRNLLLAYNEGNTITSAPDS